MHLPVGGHRHRQRVDRCHGRNRERIRDPAAEFPDLVGADAGKSRALNRGMAAAQGSHFVFVDADDEAGEGLRAEDVGGPGARSTSSAPTSTRRRLNPKTRAGWHGDERRHTDLPRLPTRDCRAASRGCAPRRASRWDPTTRRSCPAEDVDYTWRAFALGRNVRTAARRRSCTCGDRRTARAAFRKSRQLRPLGRVAVRALPVRGDAAAHPRKFVGPWRWMVADCGPQRRLHGCGRSPGTPAPSTAGPRSRSGAGVFFP